MEWWSVITAVIGALAGGGLTRVLTVRQTRKKGDIEALRDIIETLREENKRKDDELAENNRNRVEHIKKYEDKCEEAAASKQMMCIHLGCSLRDPLLGKGGDWFDAHHNDASLGVDYTPVNVLMKRLGQKRKIEDETTSE